MEYALLDYIDLYVQPNTGPLQHYASGDRIPFNNRAVGYRHPNFMLELMPGQSLELLLRIASKSSIQAPLRLYTLKAFAELNRDAQFSIGLYYGILIALLLYNLILFISLFHFYFLTTFLHLKDHHVSFFYAEYLHLEKLNMPQSSLNASIA